MRALVTAVVLLAAGAAAFKGRQMVIASYFPRGPGGAAPPTLAQPARGQRGTLGAGRAELVRVALLDGVDRATALELPAWDALCARGIDLRVDVGFPTVSLPVQSVLWTGLTQQQSGIEFVQGVMKPPPDGSLPAQVARSASVAEASPYIAGSFGFGAALPAVDIGKGPALAAWKGIFPAMAHELVVSDRPLVFVHLLGPDTAGHLKGRASPEFAAAAARADAILGGLVEADHRAHGDRTRWLVMADHGHRDAGGHGGSEAAIRIVRACITGGTAPFDALPAGHLVHLVDLSRALADSLGLAPHPDSAGRPLGAALTAAEEPRVTLPRPGVLRWAVAAALLAAAALVTWYAARGRAWRLPWWWVLAYLSLVTIETVPSLSVPMIYKPLGRDIYMAALPGLILLAITAGAAMRRQSPVRVAVTQLAVPTAITLAGLALSWRSPPLMPVWSAHASAFLVLSFSGMAVVALASLAALVPFGSGRATPAETSRTAP
ncbi:MAG TPA: alkaline phosphatase family protein [Kofleriaceae bacterium]|nr:alkaline phosphatase family protein [Kofleriaceae bacterium]